MEGRWSAKRWRWSLGELALVEVRRVSAGPPRPQIDSATLTALYMRTTAKHLDSGVERCGRVGLD